LRETVQEILLEKMEARGKGKKGKGRKAGRREGKMVW
jgi:hypothetical protein